MISPARDPRVKICGLTRPQDACLAIELGAWALGFVFYSKSPRAISPAQVARICSELPGNSKTVGVLVDSSLDEILEIVRLSGVGAVQLHGDESPEFCRALKQALPKLDVIKAFRIRDRADLQRITDYAFCEAILLDAFVSGAHGGTGQAFDWSLAEALNSQILPPVILAGGLRAENIQEAWRSVKPWALDISSGVEASPGTKDETSLRAFFAAIKECK